MLSQAKQPVELHRETAERVLTPPSIPKLFDHSNENQITYLTEGGEGLRGMSSRSGQAWQTSVIRTQLKKKKKTGLGDSALHSSRAKCGGGGELSRLLQQSLACGNGEGDGSQHVATAGRV